MAQRHYQSHEYQYEEYIPKEKQASYQTYQARNTKNYRVKELVLTVISSYIYLSLGMPVFIALTLASVTGFIGLRLIQIGLKKKFRPKQTHK